MTIGTLADQPVQLDAPPAPRLTLPKWQIAPVLVGWPTAYLVNSSRLFGLLFGGLFLWRSTLAPGMCLHAAFDMFAILA